MEHGELFGRIRSKFAQLGASSAQSPEDRDAYSQLGEELEELGLQFSWLRRNQRALDERLGKIEQSLLFRIVRWPGAKYAQARGLLGRWFPGKPSDYQDWLSYERRVLLPDHDQCLVRASAFDYKPLFSVVIEIRESRPEWLRETIASVAGQIYGSWELCVSVDEQVDLAGFTCLDELTNSGHRVRVVRKAESSAITAALNAASAEATGEYIGFLNQGDVLSPYALYYVAEALQTDHSALIYTDEDSLSPDGTRFNPVFKPAWSPDLLASVAYLGRYLTVSRVVFIAAGGFRSGANTSEYLDLALRIAERGEKIVHIPRILYHRRGAAEIVPGDRERKDWAPGPISLIICSKTPKLLNSALNSIVGGTSHTHYEIIVAEHCPEGKNPEIARVAEAHGCALVSVSGPFNFSAINNVASERATGEVLVFLNDDVEPLRADWLLNLRSNLGREEIGIVGAKLLYPTGAIQHAGVVVGIGDGAGHVNRHNQTGKYWKWIDETRNVSAVTGACMAIRTEVFRQLGGFDTVFPNNYNDVDICLRAQEAGYRVLYEPAALLRHYEGQTRKLVVGHDERERFYRRWHRIIEKGDPFYNPNLSLESEEPCLSFSGAQDELVKR